jgi:hypothetical protein
MMIRVVTRVINENKGTQRMYINLMTSAKTFNEYFWIISYLKLNRIYPHPLLTEVPVPSQENARSYVYVLGVYNFGIASTVWYFLLFNFIMSF